MICPDCKGSGQIKLFTSVEPCQKCMGSGVLLDAPEGRTVVMQPGESIDLGEPLVTLTNKAAPPLPIMLAIASAPARQGPMGRVNVRHREEIWGVEVPAEIAVNAHVSRYLFFDRASNTFNVGGFKGEEVGLILNIAPAPSEQAQAVADQIRGDSEVALPKAAEIGRVSVMEDGQGQQARLFTVPLKLAKEAFAMDAPVLYHDALQLGFNLLERGNRVGPIRLAMTYLTHQGD